MQETQIELATIFDEAKDHNEFEFVITLLNYKSIGSSNAQSNLYEWFEALTSYITQYKLLQGKEKARMAALFYSTFFENSDFYNILGSLCRIRLGFRASSYLFWKTRKLERLLGIGEKEEFILDLLADAGKRNLITFFKENHYPVIRNTFFHSAYSLDDDEYMIHDSGTIVIDGVGKDSFSLNSFFYPLVDNTISFFEAFRDLYRHHFKSYQVDKKIGPNPLGSSGLIIGTPNGLGGIRIPNAVQFFGEWHDSGIWFDDRWGHWAAHNLRINLGSVEEIEISDQLARYENKQRIMDKDEAFNNLLDKISERGRDEELTRAVRLLIKLGDERYQEMDQEQNEYKKQALPQRILPYYEKAVELGSKHFEMGKVHEKIAELQSLLGK